MHSAVGERRISRWVVVVAAIGVLFLGGPLLMMLRYLVVALRLPPGSLVLPGAGAVVLVSARLTRGRCLTLWRVLAVEQTATFALLIAAFKIPTLWTAPATTFGMAVAVFAVIVGGVWWLGLRHRAWQTEASWWGKLAAGWGSVAGGNLIAQWAILVLAGVLAGFRAVTGHSGAVATSLLFVVVLAAWSRRSNANALVLDRDAAYPRRPRLQRAMVQHTDGTTAPAQQQWSPSDDGQATAAPAVVPTKTFADVGGYEDVKKQLREVADLLLRNPERAIEYGIKKAGAVLQGPPGTGKTFLMECLAGEYQARFRLLSASSLAGGGMGDLEKQLTANVDAAIAEAQSGIPTILAIDEIDAIAPSRSGAAISEWGRLSVNGLLAQVDRVKEVPGVLMLATTNHLETLDDALLRDGRLEMHLRVDLPDTVARTQILEAVLAGRPVASIDVQTVSERTRGYTAAALTRLVNDAATTAEKADRLIETDDLLAAWESSGGNDRPTVEDAGLDTLVLRPETKKSLRGVIRRLKDRDRILGGNQPTGVLLEGPPGTGKTSIAEALAAEAGMSFYAVNPGQLRGGVQGASEANIRQLFARARRNAPAIIFFDELESIAKRRGAFNNAHGDDMLTALLSEIDGMGSTAAGGAPVFVIGATNRPDDLDEAITRSGRLGIHIHVGLPDRGGRIELITSATAAASRPVDPAIDVDWLADATDGWAPADIVGLVKRADDRAYDDDHPTVTVDDFATVLREMSTSVDTGPATRVSA